MIYNFNYIDLLKHNYSFSFYLKNDFYIQSFVLVASNNPKWDKSLGSYIVSITDNNICEWNNISFELIPKDVRLYCEKYIRSVLKLKAFI